jgi:hypothetical protein
MQARPPREGPAGSRHHHDEICHEGEQDSDRIGGRFEHLASQLLTRVLMAWIDTPFLPKGAVTGRRWLAPGLEYRCLTDLRGWWHSLACEPTHRRRQGLKPPTHEAMELSRKGSNLVTTETREDALSFVSTSR